MQSLLALIESLQQGMLDPNGKSALGHLGVVSCANRVHIRHVPFYEHCLLVVLAGRKIIYDQYGTVVCDAGSALTIPAPGSFDLRNELDVRNGRYRALIIPFQSEHLQRLRQLHGIEHRLENDDIRVLSFDIDEMLQGCLTHYLATPESASVLTHRLLEILLMLAQKDARLLSYMLNQASWAQRIRAILAADLAREWELPEVCQQLAISESTLRRHLQREATGFRELLYELRLSTALMQLLQTTLPVYQIADACGYQSVSRFSSNFRKRFGLAPTELRAAVDDKEQILAVSEQLARS